MAGRGFQLNKDDCALLVIDMQRYFCDEKSDSCVPGIKKVITNIRRLIKCFKERNRPIIFTRHIDSRRKNNLMLKWWRENITEDNPMSVIIDVLDTKAGRIIIKEQYDAFLYTELERILKTAGVGQVVISGVLTNLCCETTARSAFMRGFEVYFCIDATATYTREMHKATLLNLGYGFATLLTTDDIL